VPTILIENHSSSRYEQRVLGTYVFLEESLKLLASDGATCAPPITSRQRPAARRDPRQFRDRPENDPDKPCTRSFKGITYETYDSPASGGQEMRWLGRPIPSPGRCRSTPRAGARP
jgi:hypothetical protein